MCPPAQIPLSKSVTSQARVFSTSLTPFLYLTKTLEGQPWDAKFRNPLRRTHRGHRSLCSTSRNSFQATATPVYDSISSEEISTAISSVPAKYRINVPRALRQKANSPIPQNFDQVQGLIDRLFSETSLLSDSEEFAEDDEKYEMGGDIYEEIAIIFENAIRELRIQEERAVRSMIKNRAISARHHLPRAINASGDLSRTPKFIAMPFGERPSLATDPFYVERQIHEEDFMRELEQSQTDDDVWSVLETKAFSLFRSVRELYQGGPSQWDDETGSELEARKKPRSRKTHSEQMETNRVPVLLEAKAEAEAEAEAEATFQSSSPSTSPSRPLVTQLPPVTFPPGAIHSIIQHNYGRYCLKALQLLRREFPSSLYAFMILPTIKKLGLISSRLGATSSLYNELLYLRWTEQADLHAMADILEEMKNRGVWQDSVTTAVMQVVEREREAQLNNEAEEKGEQTHERHVDARPRSTTTAAWWKLKRVQAGWYRLQNNFNVGQRNANWHMRELRVRREAEEKEMKKKKK